MNLKTKIQVNSLTWRQVFIEGSSPQFSGGISPSPPCPTPGWFQHKTRVLLAPSVTRPCWLAASCLASTLFFKELAHFPRPWSAFSFPWFQTDPYPLRIFVCLFQATNDFVTAAHALSELSHLVLNATWADLEQPTPRVKHTTHFYWLKPPSSLSLNAASHRPICCVKFCPRRLLRARCRLLHLPRKAKYLFHKLTRVSPKWEHQTISLRLYLPGILWGKTPIFTWRSSSKTRI